MVTTRRSVTQTVAEPLPTIDTLVVAARLAAQPGLEQGKDVVFRLDQERLGTSLVDVEVADDLHGDSSHAGHDAHLLHHVSRADHDAWVRTRHCGAALG